VVGIDHSALMIEQARRRNRSAIEAGIVDLKLGGLDLLPQLGEVFDKVFSVNVLQFLPERAAVLGMIGRVGIVTRASDARQVSAKGGGISAPWCGLIPANSGAAAIPARPPFSCPSPAVIIPGRGSRGLRLFSRESLAGCIVIVR
jgi:SAM-dependent methyltransferase